MKALVFTILILQTVLGATAWSAGFSSVSNSPPNGTPEKPKWTVRVADGVESCERWLTEKTANLPQPLQKAIKLAGWPTLVTPLSWGLKHPDKVAYFYEIAKTSVWINTAGAVISRVIKGHPESIPQILENPYANLISPYISYQVVNAARNGVALRKGIATRTKILSNWLLTTYVYSMTDILPKVLSKGPANATAIETSFAFHAMWATFSEVMRQYVTNPIFFHMFPKETMKTRMRETLSTDELLSSFQNELESLKQQHDAAKAEGASSGKIKDLREEMLAARMNIYWTKKLRKDLVDGQQIPEERWKKFQKFKDRSQIGIGLTLLVVFFTAKLALIGDDQDPGYLYRAIGNLHKFIEGQWAELFGPESETFDATVDAVVERLATEEQWASPQGSQ